MIAPRLTIAQTQHGMILLLHGLLVYSLQRGIGNARDNDRRGIGRCFSSSLALLPPLLQDSDGVALID